MENQVDYTPLTQVKTQVATPYSDKISYRQKNKDKIKLLANQIAPNDPYFALILEGNLYGQLGEGLFGDDQILSIGNTILPLYKKAVEINRTNQSPQQQQVMQEAAQQTVHLKDLPEPEKTQTIQQVRQAVEQRPQLANLLKDVPQENILQAYVNTGINKPVEEMTPEEYYKFVEEARSPGLGMEVDRKNKEVINTEKKISDIDKRDKELENSSLIGTLASNITDPEKYKQYVALHPEVSENAKAMRDRLIEINKQGNKVTEYTPEQMNKIQENVNLEKLNVEKNDQTINQDSNLNKWLGNKPLTTQQDNSLLSNIGKSAKWLLNEAQKQDMNKVNMLNTGVSNIANTFSNTFNQPANAMKSTLSQPTQNKIQTSTPKIQTSTSTKISTPTQSVSAPKVQTYVAPKYQTPSYAAPKVVQQATVKPATQSKAQPKQSTAQQVYNAVVNAFKSIFGK